MNYAQQRAEREIKGSEAKKAKEDLLACFSDESKINRSPAKVINLDNLEAKNNKTTTATRVAGVNTCEKTVNPTVNPEGGTDKNQPKLPADSKVAEKIAEAMGGNYAIDVESNALYSWNSSSAHWKLEGAAEKHLKPKAQPVMDALYADKGYSSGKFSGACSLLLTRLPSMPVVRRSGIFFTNGVFDVHRREFEQTEVKNLFPKSSTGVEYYESSGKEDDCPVFAKYLLQLVKDECSDLQNERLRVMLASMYMILTRSTHWQMFLEVTGKGGTGKSTFCQLLELLVGSESMFSCDIPDLDDPQRLSSMINASMLMMPDQEAYQGSAKGLLRVTGGDSVQCRFLYGQSFSAKIRAICVIVGNEPMKLRNAGGAFTRRRVSVSLNNVVPKDQQDSMLIEKMRDEVPAIVSFVLTWSDIVGGDQAARSILKNSVDGKDATSTREDTDHVVAFAKDLHYEEGVKCKVGGKPRARTTPQPRQVLYHAWLEYCEYNGITPLQTDSFIKAFTVAASQYGNVKFSKPKNCKMFTGVTPTSPHGSEPEWLENCNPA